MSKGDFCDMATDFGFCRVTACMKKNTKAEPVKHGEWIKADSQQYFRKHYPCFTCSECGYRKDSQKKWNYCPNCGARMDKE
jgi:rubrerythrin